MSALPPVLVVDDEKNMRLSLQTVLGDEGYQVRAVERAEEGLHLIERGERFLLAITDGCLDGMSGYEFLGRVRQGWPDLPVLMITAYATPKLAADAIKAGAIDYLAKPFAVEELEARVRALIRRSQGSPDPVLTLGALRLDRATGAAYLGDALLELTRRERSVLETLVSRAGIVVPKSRLSADVFDYDDAVSPNALEVYIGRLRRKLEKSGLEIRTVRGLGYLLRQI